MENASKALLIAAALLIVILLISFGIKIFNSSKDSSKDAQAVGESIVSSTSSARISAILSMIDYKDDTVFLNFIKDNYGNGKALSKNEVIELYELIMKRTQILYSKKYKHNTIHIPQGRGMARYDISKGTVNYENITNKKYKLDIQGEVGTANGVAAVIEEYDK